MESPDSPYAPASPEAHPKRAPHPKSPGQDNKNGTYIRFLITNTEAGCIIGKGGSTITEFQSQSGARIQLSRNHEFFPGTSDRIIMVSGSFEDIIKAMELINEKLLTELVQVEENGDAPSLKKENDIESRFKLRMIVPNGCCGGIIGKGGATIKQFIEDSHAGIKISPQDHSYAGLNDRIVTLTGSSKEQMRALYLILSKLTEDSHYSQSVNTPYPYGGLNFSNFHGAPVGYMIQSVPYHVNYGPNGSNGGRYPNNKGAASKPRGGAQEGQGISVTIGVADEHIGAVVGRAGRNIMEISQTSGARIKISDRGDFMTGTSDRKVTITGTQEAIRAAESLIMQKITMNSESQ